MAKILQRLIMVAVFAVFILSIVNMAVAEGNESREASDTNYNSKDIGVSADEKAVIKADIKDKINTEKEKIKEIKMRKLDGVKEVKDGNLSKEDKKSVLQKIKEQTKGERVAEKASLKAIKDDEKVKMDAFKENVKKYREEFKTAVEKHKEIREEYTTERNNLLKLRDEAQGCAKDSADCKAKKDDVKKGVLKHLENTINLIDSSLARLKAHVQASTTLNDADKTRVLAQIDASEVSLTVEKEKVQTLAQSANVTNVQLKDAVKELKKIWQDVTESQRKIIGELTTSKMEHVGENHAQYATSMQTRIDHLKSKSVDTTDLEKIKAEFVDAQKKLDADRTSSLDAWRAAENKDSARDAWHAAQTTVKDDLEQSKEILRRFLSLYKELAQKAGVSEKADEQGEKNESDEHQANVSVSATAQG